MLYSFLKIKSWQYVIPANLSHNRGRYGGACASIYKIVGTRPLVVAPRLEIAVKIY
jgi:hypothetical protein